MGKGSEAGRGGSPRAVFTVAGGVAAGYVVGRLELPASEEGLRHAAKVMASHERRNEHETVAVLEGAGEPYVLGRGRGRRYFRRVVAAAERELRYRREGV